MNIGHLFAFVLIQTLLLGCDGNVVEIRPPHNAGTVGSEVFIDCFINCTLPDTFEWREFVTTASPVGKQIYNSTSGVIDNRFDVIDLGDRYRLVINDLQPDLAGMYECGWSESDVHVNGTLLALSQIECHPEDEEVLHEHDVIFWATIYYYGVQSLFAWQQTWSGPEGRIRQNQFLLNDKFTRFNGIVNANNGTDGQEYTGSVKLFSLGGATPGEIFEEEEFSTNCTSSYRLIYGYKPRDISVSLDVEEDGRVDAAEGDQITCTSDAFPEARYEWLVHAENRTIFGNSLTVTRDLITQESHLTCTAQNNYGEESVSIQLNRIITQTTGLPSTISSQGSFIKLCVFLIGLPFCCLARSQ